MPATPDVIAAAQEQVAQGFAAFALGRNSKVPVTEHGFKNATTNPEWVKTQLQAPTAGNYGIVWPTDSERPVVVFDLDNGKEGLERPWQDRLLELINRIGPLPKTKSTTTPSGGRHAFYGWPVNVPIPPGDELFGFTVRWPGRGYLVGPGSSLNGKVYVAGPELEIADLPPEWIRAAVADTAPSSNEGALIVVRGGFVLPEAIPAGRRYPTVRDYIASRYNSGLSSDELWELVKTQVAPLFTVPKTEADLRSDFNRAMAKIVERLGPPRKGMSAQDAVEAMSAIPVKNLSTIAVEAVVWLWHRYLPVGSVTLLDGNPGEGKSTIVADLIARLTSGTEWPDGSEVGGSSNVLYVTKEDDAATQVRPRIEVAGGISRRVYFVAADLLFPRDLGRFKDLLDELRPRLVILDPLMSYLEGKVKVISDNEVRSALMTPLADLARVMDCVLLVIRHFNKGSGQTALLRGAGSLGGLAGAARMVLALAPDPEVDDPLVNARVFGVVKSNYEARPPSLKVTIESAPVEGFQMTVSRASWQGTSDTSVGDLMERTREEHQLVLAAEESLEELLRAAGGEMPGSEVQTSMQARRHSKGSIYNAARALHIHIARVGFPSRTMWSLPKPLISGLSHPDDRTTVTTGGNGSYSESYESPTTVTTVTTDSYSEELKSSHSSQSSSGAGNPPRTHAREGSCRVCGRAVEIDTVGRLRPHYADGDLHNAKWGTPPCAGSAERPVE